MIKSDGFLCVSLKRIWLHVKTVSVSWWCFILLAFSASQCMDILRKFQMLISFALRFSCQNHLHSQTRLFVHVQRTIASGLSPTLPTVPLTYYIDVDPVRGSDTETRTWDERKDFAYDNFKSRFILDLYWGWEILRKSLCYVTYFDSCQHFTFAVVELELTKWIIFCISSST